MSEASILVLGATGNVGSEVIKQLTVANQPVIAGIYNKLSQSDDRFTNSLPVDYNDLDLLCRAFSGVGTLVVIIPDSPEMELHAQAIVRCASECHIARYVLISGAGVTLAPTNVLSQRLRAMEQQFVQSNMKGVILRPTFFMQNLINHFTANELGEYHLAMGAGKVNYIDVRDVAKAVVSAIGSLSWQLSKSTVFHLTGSESYTFSEVVGVLNEVCNSDFTYTDMPLSDQISLLAKAGLSKWRVEMMTEVFMSIRKSSYDFWCEDFKRLTEAKPVSLKEFVQVHKTYFRTNYQLNHK